MTNRLAVGITSALVLVTVLIFSCSQAMAASAPAQPTAVLAQSTMAPAKTVNFPEKDKSITIIVPVAPGGSMDIGARMLAPIMEKDLGVPVRVVNKAGAGQQVGGTELARSKPDGYTLGYLAIPSIMIPYLDPDRKAVFNRRSFEPVSQVIVDGTGIAVKSDSQYRTIKDLLDAAKAKPESMRVAVSGLLGVLHLMALQVQQLAGVKFAIVVFDGGAPARTALLGGHVDASVNTIGELSPFAKEGQLRVLGIADSQESPFLPGAKTLRSEGVGAQMVSTHGIAVPAGTPKEIVAILDESIRKAMTSGDLSKRMQDVGLDARYGDGSVLASVWSEMEAEVSALIQVGKQQQQK